MPVNKVCLFPSKNCKQRLQQACYQLPGLASVQLILHRRVMLAGHAAGCGPRITCQNVSLEHTMTRRSPHKVSPSSLQSKRAVSQKGSKNGGTTQHPLANSQQDLYGMLRYSLLIAVLFTLPARTDLRREAETLAQPSFVQLSGTFETAAEREQ